MELQLLQDWFIARLENYENSNLIYRDAWKSQILWVRDVLSYVIGTQPTVSEYHTSKSVQLPVYTFVLHNGVTVKLRNNFHDWCVRVDREFDNSMPEYLSDVTGQGYYEGMDEFSWKTEFCTNSKEQVFAMVWWMTEKAFNDNSNK